MSLRFRNSSELLIYLPLVVQRKKKRKGREIEERKRKEKEERKSEKNEEERVIIRTNSPTKWE